jgi:hypothetical protein
LRLRGIRTLDGVNEFLREHYIAEFNRRFTAGSIKAAIQAIFSWEFGPLLPEAMFGRGRHVGDILHSGHASAVAMLIRSIANIGTRT